MSEDAPHETMAADLVETGKTSIEGTLADASGILDDLLKQQADENPELAKEILSSWETSTRDFISTNGKIQWEAVSSQLEWREKLSLLVKVALNGGIGEILGSFVSGSRVVSRSFGSELERVKAEGSAITVKGSNNIIYPRGTDFSSKIQWAINMQQYISEGGEAEETALSVIPGSTIVSPRPGKEGGLQAGIGNYILYLRKGLAAVPKPDGPITLLLKGAGEAKDPGAKEIFFVYAPTDGLPKKNNKVDLVEMKAMQEIFKVNGEGVGVQWYAPDVVAGVFVLEGVAPEQAMAAAGVAGDATLLMDLQKLEKLKDGEDPYAPATTTGTETR